MEAVIGYNPATWPCAIGPSPSTSWSAEITNLSNHSQQIKNLYPTQRSRLFLCLSLFTLPCILFKGLLVEPPEREFAVGRICVPSMGTPR